MPPHKNAKIASKLLILLKADFRKWRELSNSGGHTRSARLQRVVPAETHQFRKPQGNLSNLLLHRCEARALKPIETLNIRDRQCSEHLAIGSKIVSDAVSVSRDKVPTLGPKVNGPGLSTCDTTMVRPSW